MIDDPEIPELIAQAKSREEDVQRRVWEEMQRYRREALEAAGRGENTIEKELMVLIVRAGFKERLRGILGG